MSKGGKESVQVGDFDYLAMVDGEVEEGEEEEEEEEDGEEEECEAEAGASTGSAGRERGSGKRASSAGSGRGRRRGSSANPGLTAEERRKGRLETNRLSARLSRLRKKNYMSQLEERAAALHAQVYQKRMEHAAAITQALEEQRAQLLQTLEPLAYKANPTAEEDGLLIGACCSALRFTALAGQHTPPFFVRRYFFSPPSPPPPYAPSPPPLQMPRRSS